MRSESEERFEPEERFENLRMASEAIWSALSSLGYLVGLAQGQSRGEEPGADAFRVAMTSARSALNQILPSKEQSFLEDEQ
jgi:hypothetical protein